MVYPNCRFERLPVVLQDQLPSCEQFHVRFRGTLGEFGKPGGQKGEEAKDLEPEIRKLRNLAPYYGGTMSCLIAHSFLLTHYRACRLLFLDTPQQNTEADQQSPSQVRKNSKPETRNPKQLSLTELEAATETRNAHLFLIFRFFKPKNS